VVIWLSFDRVHRLSQQTLTLPRCSMMLQIQPTASADETRQVRGAVSSEMGAVWMRNVLSSGGFVWGLLHGSCGTWAYLRREPGCSLGQCWRRSSDLLQAWPGGMPPHLGRCSSRGPGTWSVILLRVRSSPGPRQDAPRAELGYGPTAIVPQAVGHSDFTQGR